MSKSACPQCQKPVDPIFRPFCSKRCADIDLGRWLKGGYAIPGAPTGTAGQPSPSNSSESDPGED